MQLAAPAQPAATAQRPLPNSTRRRRPDGPGTWPSARFHSLATHASHRGSSVPSLHTPLPCALEPPPLPVRPAPPRFALGLARTPVGGPSARRPRHPIALAAPRQATLSVDKARRSAAEALLAGWEADAAPGFLTGLLRIVEQTQAVPTVRAVPRIHTRPQPPTMHPLRRSPPAHRPGATHNCVPAAGTPPPLSHTSLPAGPRPPPSSLPTSSSWPPLHLSFFSGVTALPLPPFPRSSGCSRPSWPRTAWAPRGARRWAAASGAACRTRRRRPCGRARCSCCSRVCGPCQPDMDGLRGCIWRTAKCMCCSPAAPAAASTAVPNETALGCVSHGVASSFLWRASCEVRGPRLARPLAAPLEPVEGVAVQLSLLLANIARFDFPGRAEDLLQASPGAQPHTNTNTNTHPGPRAWCCPRRPERTLVTALPASCARLPLPLLTEPA